MHASSYRKIHAPSLHKNLLWFWTTFILGISLLSVHSMRSGTIFYLQYALTEAILENGYNFGTIDAWCMFLVFIESFDDFEQLLFQAFFSYLFKKLGQGQFYIYNMPLWRPFWKMAAMSAKCPIWDGLISKFVHNILVYLCAKFGAFMTKCTIGLISCSTIRKSVYIKCKWIRQILGRQIRFKRCQCRRPRGVSGQTVPNRANTVIKWVQGKVCPRPWSS